MKNGVKERVMSKEEYRKMFYKDWEVIAKRLEAEAEERLAMRQYEEEYNENPRRD